MATMLDLERFAILASPEVMSAFDGGFNRSMQHTEPCMSRRSVADEAKTADPVLGKPEGPDVGALEEG
jgi:hypothetical protein